MDNLFFPINFVVYGRQNIFGIQNCLNRRTLDNTYVNRYNYFVISFQKGCVQCYLVNFVLNIAPHKLLLQNIVRSLKNMRTFVIRFAPLLY